jgi:hypothetical protein
VGRIEKTYTKKIGCYKNKVETRPKTIPVGSSKRGIAIGFPKKKK